VAIAVLLVVAVQVWAFGSVAGSVCAIAWVTMAVAMMQKDVLHSSFAFVLPHHRNVPRMFVLGLAVLSGACLLAVSRLGAPESGRLAAATFAIGASLSVWLALGVFALRQPLLLFMLPWFLPLVSRIPGISDIGWIASYAGTVLLLGAASMAGGWYALEGRRLGRWVRFRPNLGLGMNPEEVRRFRDAVTARRRYAEPMWVTALIASMRAPNRSPSWRAVAGDFVGRFGEYGRVVTYGYLPTLVLVGVSIGYNPKEMRETVITMGAVSWSVAAAPSRLRNALPLGRRVLFTSALISSVVTTIAATLLFVGSDILLYALAPYLPVLGRARFVPPVYSPHLVAAVPLIGLGTTLMSACMGKVDRMVVLLVLFTVSGGLLYFGIRLDALSVLWAAAWGFAVVLLRARYLRRSLV
jgi:hypothetical protein